MYDDIGMITYSSSFLPLSGFRNNKRHDYSSYYV